MPHVFEAARQARAEARAAGKSAEEVEQLVIKASEEAKARGYSQGGQVQGQAYRNNAKKLRVLQDTYRTALNTPVAMDSRILVLVALCLSLNSWS